MNKYDSASHYLRMSISSIPPKSTSSLISNSHFYFLWHFCAIYFLKLCPWRTFVQLAWGCLASITSTACWWQYSWDSNAFEMIPKLASDVSISEFGGQNRRMGREKVPCLHWVAEPPRFPNVKRMTGKDFQPLRPTPEPYMTYNGKQHKEMNQNILLR